MSGLFKLKALIYSTVWYLSSLIASLQCIFGFTTCHIQSDLLFLPHLM